MAEPPGESPWRSRDFRIVLAGGLVNDIGDWLLLIALPVFVYTKTGSGASTAALFLVELVVAVALIPLLGVTPDRLWRDQLQWLVDRGRLAGASRAVDAVQLAVLRLPVGVGVRCSDHHRLATA